MKKIRTLSLYRAMIEGILTAKAVEAHEEAGHSVVELHQSPDGCIAVVVK